MGDSYFIISFLQLHLTTQLCPWTWHSIVALQLKLWWYPSLVIMWWKVPSLSQCLWHQQTVLSLWTRQPLLSPFRMMMIVSSGVWDKGRESLVNDYVVESVEQFTAELLVSAGRVECGLIQTQLQLSSLMARESFWDGIVHCQAFI